MAIHLYRNRDDEYILDDNGFQKVTRVLLRRANSKSSFGGCVTASPVQLWLSYPRQVFGFANADGTEDIHKCGFDQGPYAWDDYSGDYYELCALSVELIDKLRRLTSELDIEVILESISRINELLTHINWYSNQDSLPASLAEALTANEQILLYMERTVVMLSKYFLGTKKLLFD